MTEPNKKNSVPKHHIAPSPVANYLLIGAGSMFTAMVIAGFIVGYMLDYFFDTMPIFFLSCGVLGFIGGMQKVRLLTKRLDQQATQQKKDEQNVE
ncbi:ATP synthase protein I [hydrothermal vent metagenome]|uniref:ATP synthase protein I n=1 Tax=hydrothermal vent metagenome TaxID=652676 RepID=A0A3B0WDW3_9ZZZZ